MRDIFSNQTEAQSFLVTASHVIWRWSDFSTAGNH